MLGGIWGFSQIRVTSLGYIGVHYFGKLPFGAKGLGYRVRNFGLRDLRVEFLAARNRGVWGNLVCRLTLNPERI